jgi:hypothetical protein
MVPGDIITHLIGVVTDILVEGKRFSFDTCGIIYAAPLPPPGTNTRRSPVSRAAARSTTHGTEE